MRIVIDCRFWGIKDTGLGRYTKNLVENLLRIDKKNNYILTFQKGVVKNFLTMKQWSNVTIVSDNIPHYSVKEQFELPKILKKIKPDLIHFPHFNVPFFCPFPYVVTIHDLIKHNFKGLETTTRNPFIYWFKYWSYKKVFENAVRKAKRIIVPSKFVKKELLKHCSLDKDKIKVIYEATNENFQFPISNFQKNYKIINKYKIKKPFLLYVGNAYPHKNLRRLILAIKKINSPNTKHQTPNTNLIIVCSRNIFYKRLKKTIKEFKAEKFIKLPGFVSDKELKALYSQAKAFIFPSLMEGFGLPGLEAMSLNCPVLCSSIPTFKEIYGQAVVYFNAENIDDIKEKILKVMNFSSKERQGLIKKGKSQAKKYSWQKCAKQTLQAYQNILG